MHGCCCWLPVLWLKRQFAGRCVVPRASLCFCLDALRAPYQTCAPPPTRMQGPDASPPLLQAARTGSAADVEQLLQQPGCSVDQRGGEGETALHWAADRGHLAVLRLLLSSGADVNATDADGLTPLHYAALAEQQEAAELLASTPGVRLGLRNGDGETAADVAPAGWDFLLYMM